MIDIPEVQSFEQQPRFYREDNKDFVEISFLGAKDTVIKKVTPELMAKFRDEWNAYCDGRPMEPRKGTPLTVFPEISEERNAEFIRRNLHTVEELAQLNDHQCQGLGHGLIALRKKAQNYILQKQAEEHTRNQKRISTESAKVGPAPEENNEIDELKSVVADQGKKIDALLEAISSLVTQPKKREKKNGAVIGNTDSKPGV